MTLNYKLDLDLQTYGSGQPPCQISGLNVISLVGKSISKVTYFVSSWM